MVNIHPQFITDNSGKKVSVVLAMPEFKKILEDLEELDDIRLYEEAHSSSEPSFPIDEAFKLVEANRHKKK